MQLKVLYMKNIEALDTLKDIKGMMEKSTKCLSLSRFSGIFLGTYAIFGAFATYYLLVIDSFGMNANERKLTIAIIAIAVLALSILTAAFLSERKAKRTGDSIFSQSAKRVHKNLFVCLLPGGVLTIAMFLNGNVQYITTIMLCFYGLALISASRYTFRDILYLGYTMLTLGMANSFFTRYSLLFWTIGFGVFHIFYGILMYYKYERKS